MADQTTTITDQVDRAPCALSYFKQTVFQMVEYFAKIKKTRAFFTTATLDSAGLWWHSQFHNGAPIAPIRDNNRVRIAPHNVTTPPERNGISVLMTS